MGQTAFQKALKRLKTKSNTYSLSLSLAEPGKDRQKKRKTKFLVLVSFLPQPGWSIPKKIVKKIKQKGDV